jgi:hypothetical protein
LKKDNQSTARTNNTNGDSTNISNNSSKVSTVRLYSSFFPQSNNDDILKKFENLLTANSDQIIRQTTDVIKQESIAIQNKIENILKMNNIKLCYFVVNTVKTLVPGVKFNANKMKIIQEAFSNYQLGEIKLDNLKNHFCPTPRDLVNTSVNGQFGEDEFHQVDIYTE